MINTEKFNQIVETAKAKTSDPKWLRAIEKAAKAILSGEIIVTTLAHGALITTANGTYSANGHCNCEAARRGHSQCYHRAAARLMDNYETEMAQAVSSLGHADPDADYEAEYDEAVAYNVSVTLAEDIAESPRQNLIIEISNIWDRTQTTPLSVELMARFGKNKLEMLDTDMLRRVRLAIAA